MSALESSSSGLHRRPVTPSIDKATEIAIDTRTRDISVGLVVSAVFLTLTVGLVFLLGVNIVIQYRTLNVSQPVNALLKASYIVLSIAGVYGLHQLNLHLFRRMMNRDQSNSYANISRFEPVELRAGV